MVSSNDDDVYMKFIGYELHIISYYILNTQIDCRTWLRHTQLINYMNHGNKNHKFFNLVHNIGYSFFLI